MIFYSFVSFNVLTNDSSRIKKKESSFYYILGGIDSPKKQKKKTTLVVKPRLMIILEVNVRKKVICVFKIFLMYFIHVQYLIAEYLRSYF